MHRAVVRLLNRVELGVCPAAYLIAGNHHLMTGTYSWVRAAADSDVCESEGVGRRTVGRIGR
jgi:hypothetical protein